MIQSTSCYVRLLFVCLSLVSSVGDQNQEGWRLLVKESIVKLSKVRTCFFKDYIFLGALNLFGAFWVLSWGTSLLYIVGDLAGGGSLAMAVDVTCHVAYFCVLFCLNLLKTFDISATTRTR